ncbi:MAG TPA: LysR family transcriptional regulator [Blastocatellia bacterium]|nr:LysR family transcriptional regulator [Blastocatellia bacterium]
MEWLNYHHLLYFWLVAKKGGVTQASAELRLAQPTISAQIRALEHALGEKLFNRVGKRLVLTDVGQVVFRYAEEIFSIGRELQQTLKGRPGHRPLRLVVGIADVVPKMVALKLLEPALHLTETVQLICREDKSDRLLAELSRYALDVVLTDAPAGPSVKVRAYNHLLGESPIVFCGTKRLASLYRRKFPQSLNEAPMLLPAENTMLRGSLNQWFEANNLRPKVVGEFEDSALLMVFGQKGIGLFPVPVVIEKEVNRQYGVCRVGTAGGVIERFYAVSLERKLRHPAMIAVNDAARQKLFQ